MSSGPPSPPSDDPPARSGRSWRQRLLLGSGLVVVIAVVAAASLVGYVAWRFSQIGREDVDVAKAGELDPKNYLVVGSDDREGVDPTSPDASAFIGDEGEGGGRRSDTIMIVRVDPRAGTIDMVSFPRDLWLPIARTDGRERINTAYSFDDGPQRLIDTINQNFGIEINHYIEVDFASFKGVVDAVGGIPMYFDRAMRDRNSGLVVDNPGCVKLDGTQALAFTRARQLEYLDRRGKWVDDPTGDLGRISRQQVFMRRLIDRAASATDGYDLKTMNDLLSSIAPNLNVDKGLDPGKLINLPRQFQEFSGENLQTHTLPVEQFETAGGAAVLRLDEVAAAPILDVFRPRVTDSTTPALPVSVLVQNGSGVAGQAADAREVFESLGFTVVGTADAPRPVSETVVRFGAGGETAANEIARVLRNGAHLEPDATLEPGEVVVVTGNDFRLPTTTSTSRVTGATGTSVAGTATTVAPEPETIGVVPGETPPGITCE
jgi:polyisoprenyl-teichoic acid--peptidoglycan teichoic acid transferase